MAVSDRGANDPVHRAAANDFPFQSRAARGSVCNGLFALMLGARSPSFRWRQCPFVWPIGEDRFAREVLCQGQGKLLPFTRQSARRKRWMCRSFQVATSFKQVWMALQQLDKCVVSTGDHSIEFSIISIEFANVAFDGEAINAVIRRYVTSVEERQGHDLITVRSPDHSVRVTAPKVCRQKNCFLFSDHVLLVVRTCIRRNAAISGAAALGGCSHELRPRSTTGSDFTCVLGMRG